MQKQVNVQRVQLGQEANKILQAAAEPIDRPSHYQIELALIGIPHKSIERWALIPTLGAANAVVLVDVDNLTAHPLSNLAQFALLIGRGLVERLNPEIENRAFHGNGFCPPFRRHKPP